MQYYYIVVNLAHGHKCSERCYEDVSALGRPASVTAAGRHQQQQYNAALYTCFSVPG